MLNRREFLHNSALISVAPWVPAFLTRTLQAQSSSKDDRILVVIQLDGGNDGLNTVIPFSDELYAKYRRELRIAEKDVQKLNDSVGLHPGMKDAAQLFHNGQLSIVQGVGYPNPNRSHFESMSIWHRARTTVDDRADNGWLGLAMDTTLSKQRTTADSIYVGDESIPAALKGRRANAMSLEKEADLVLVNQPGSVAKHPHDGVAAGADLAQFVIRVQDRSFRAAEELSKSEAKQTAAGTYPATELASKLKLISRLIKLNVGTRVYYASQGGYDTHTAQAFPHRLLLNEFSGAIHAFLSDMSESKLSDRVAIVAFSEFGRRVQENGSSGTDHGAAGPMFVAGESVRGGLIGDHPSLSDLDAGDLKMSFDFRSVYATLLKNWLRIDATPVLGDEFPTMEILKT